MKRKNLVFITCFLVFTSVALYIFIPERATKEKTEQKIPSLKESRFNPTLPVSARPKESAEKRSEKYDEKEVRTQLENLNKFCTEEYPEYREVFPSVEKLESVLQDEDLNKLWLNMHLKDENNQVWRLRRFLDDGPNGGVEQVVLYKEDETGFPKIVETSEKNKEVSAQELFEEKQSLGELIFTDEAYSIVRDGVDYYFELTNGQVTRIDVTSNQYHINCEVPH